MNSIKLKKICAAWGLVMTLGWPAAVGAQTGPPPRASGKPGTIEGAVISPLQNANVGAEISGIIEKFNFNEGDHVQAGQVVAEISKKRYGAMTQRAASARDARRVELEGTKKDEHIKDRMLSFNGTTELVVADAQARRDQAFARLREANEDLRVAQLNLEECDVKAPFSGFLAVRYKQPHEPVDRLEKIFALVDTSKVYAVGNLPEDQLANFKVGTRAVFVRSSGERYEGVVERMAKLIDPQSRTKRLYLLIENASGALEVGMTGSIERLGQ